jgi:hypothetical protein
LFKKLEIIYYRAISATAREQNFASIVHSSSALSAQTAKKVSG